MSDQELREYNPGFKPKPIAEFLDVKHHFEIPSYQRGYRWEKKQVLDLLEDIKSFAKMSVKSDEDDSYYLQPLVVKESKAHPGRWEVLDGQQRLTTLRLILMRIFSKSLTEGEKEVYTPDMIYDLTYTNRPQLDFAAPNPSDNIDSYYLSVAKSVIDNWFKEQIRDGEDVDSMFKQTLLFKKNPKKVKFIWYEVKDGEDLESIQIFNRLNKGKISLTSSELIKALFLMNSSKVNPGNKTRTDQLSMEWNEMERKFQDNPFWYFISNDEDDCQTRIDVLFDFVTEKPKDNADKDYSYRLFQKLYDYCRAVEVGDDTVQLDPFWDGLRRKHRVDGPLTMQWAWEYTIATFNKMVEWFENPLYYHYVGYLIANGSTPREVYNHIQEAKGNSADKEWTADDTKLELRKLIMEYFKVNTKTYLEKTAIDGLEYGSNFVFRLLLLFNVESYRKRGQRFAFDQFKTQGWDIEHIDSQNNASLIERDDRLRWLRNVAFILELESKVNERSQTAQSLLNDVNDLLPRYERGEHGIEDIYKEVCQRAIDYFKAENSAIENKDNIGNLTLLDYRTNREYQDAPFPYKRYCIIKEDKAGRRFMPAGTRNVFLKYYTDSDSESSFLDNTRWSKPDLDGYVKAIHEVVNPIFDSIVEKNIIESNE